MIATRLFNALRGIASCGTQCGCCQMHNRIAQDAVTAYERFEEKFRLVVVCKECGCICVAASHVCGDGS